MILIVLAHSGQIAFALAPFSQLNELLLENANLLSYTANGLFFLIAGYFAGKRDIRFSHIVKVFIPVWFWGVFFFAFHLLTNSPSDLVQPIDYIWYFLTGNAKFVVGYAFVQLIGIFLVPVFKKLSSSQQIICIIGLFGLTILSLTIIRMVPRLYEIFDPNNNPFLSYGFAYLWVFIVGVTQASSAKKLSVRFSILGIIASLLCANIFINFPVLGISLDIANPYTNSQFLAFFIFQLAYASKPLQSKYINQIAKLMFGVYIIHINPFSPIRTSLLVTGYPFSQFIVDLPFSFIFLTILIAIMVFISSSILEFLRQFLFKKIKSRILQKAT
jgi:hypothetical protein